MVCDKAVCERWSVTKLWELAAWEADGGGAEAGYRIKNKNLTQRCGEYVVHQCQSLLGPTDVYIPILGKL